MFVHPLLSGVPNDVLDMTTNLALLFVGMVVVLGLCILGLVIVTLVQNPWWEKRTEKTASSPLAPAFQVPKAA